MKKILLFLFFISIIGKAQTNIAIPSFSATTGSFNAASGLIKFYLNGSSHTLTVGRGANAVCFSGNNMFVAFDDALGTKGILWYSNVSFVSGSFFSSPSTPVILTTGQGTFSVATDAAGNVFCANNNGTITKFTKQAVAPFYTNAASSSMSFWNTSQFADASGVMIDDATGTLWAVSYANNQAAVCKLSTFGTAGTIKYIDGPANFFQKPEGISKDASGNVWVANNNNNEVLRINNTIVTTIVAELNANNYATKLLATPADIQNFAATPAGHQLGGLVYDNLYSSKMYVNDQVSGGNTNVYSFTANNTAPTFTATAMTQIYPGAGQAGIIPCSLLPVPLSPIAANSNIPTGQTATLTASACTADQTYRWKLAGSTVGNSIAYTTPVLNANATYTVQCVRGGTCEGPSVSVNVIVGAAPSTFVSNVAIPRLTQDSVYFYLGNNITPTHKYKTNGSTPNGISFFENNMFLSSNSSTGSGTIAWFPNVSFNPYSFTPATTPNYLFQAYGFNGVIGTTQVVSDLNGNLYAASKDGIVTKFFKQASVPFYATNRQVGIRVGAATDILGGISIDEATGTLWVTNETANSLAVLKLADIPPLPNPLTNNIPVPSTKSPFVKLIKTSIAGLLSTAFSMPQGIQIIPNQGLWFSSHNNIGTLSRLIQSKVNTILAQLNLVVPNYADELVAAADLDVYTSFVGSGGLGNRFGGLKYDAQYSKKLLISDQAAAAGSTIKNVLALDPFSASPLSTLVPTQYKQSFPGTGHIGIIPCGLLPPPTINPTVAAVTINQGSTASLTASACPATQTYEWRDGLAVVGTNATFTTPALNANKTYTVHCVSGLDCKTSGTPVLVTVIVPVSHTIVNCSANSPSNAIYRVGSTGTKPIQVSLNISIPGTYTLNVSGPNFSGTATQTYASVDPFATMWISLDYDGGGIAGTRNITISSADLTVAPCFLTTQVFDPPKFSFTDCSSGTVTGTFVAGTASTGSITVAIVVTTAGSATINLDEFGNNRMSGVLNTNLTLGQTSLTVPINYDGTGVVGDGGQFTLSSLDAQGLGPNVGFCYGPMYTLIAPSSSPCPQNVSITGSPAPMYTPNQVIQASDFISTNSPPSITITSANSNNLTYQAGKAINLNPGFAVNPGAVFTAKIGGCGNAQVNQTMKITGNKLYDIYGNQFIMRGVNYSVMDDWDFPASDKIIEIEQSNANTVRLQWYRNQASRPAYTNTDLDNLLTKCETNGMIPVLQLQDYTCSDSMAVLNSKLVPWWTSPGVVAVLNNHKKYLIINLANELGKYRWGNIYSASSYNIAALTAWKDAYKTAITSIRNAGLNMPIMIDGTDCGSDLKAFHQVGQEIIDHDPQHNIIFSGHAYWQYYPDQAADLAAVVAANIPLVFGEIANFQSETGANLCDYDLSDNVGYKYQDFLTYLQNNQMGWLSWTWVRDKCSFRNMTNNDNLNPVTFGKFNTLTTFGNDIVNNPTYGIFNTSVRTIFTP